MMTKHEKLNYLGKRLMNGDEISSYDEDILTLFNPDNISDKRQSYIRGLRRYLDELQMKYPQIETKVKDRITYFYLTKVSNIVHEYLTTSDDMSWLVQMISSSNKTLFSELEADTKERLTNVLSSEKDIFLYQNSPFEVFETEVGKQVFRSLKSAVKNNEYRNIYYNYNNEKMLKDVKCLKLIFMYNNWYVAIAKKEPRKSEKLLFLRVSFIEKVEYSSKNSYQPTQLNQYIDFFKSFQNPMSLYGVEKNIAVVRASAKVAKYFKLDMKNHLCSQTFLKENDDGSIDFTLEYTQSMEILPFIKKWLPDLKIISPKSLDEILRVDLKSYLLNQKFKL